MPEQAVADAPPQKTETTPDPLSTNVGDVFKQALAKEQGKPEPERVKDEPVKPAKAADEQKKGKAAGKEERAPQKPTSALDAAIETGKPDKTKDEEVVVEDPLKEFPEDDKKPNWKRAREVIRDLSTKLSTTEPQLGELRQKLQVAEENAKKGDPAIAKQLESVLAENAQLKDAITAVNVELLPEFRQEFIEGRSALVKTAGEKLKAYGGNPELLSDALALPEGRRRDEAIEAALGEDITATGKTKILQLISQIEEKDEKRAKLLSDPQSSFQSYEQKTAATRQKAAESAEAARQTNFERVAKGLPEKSPLFRMVDPSVPGAGEWNNDLTTARDTALKVLKPGGAEFDETATIALKGARYDSLEKMFLSTHEQLIAAKAQLAELDGAQPDAKGRKAPAKSDLEANLDKPAGDVFNETMAKLSGGGGID